MISYIIRRLECIVVTFLLTSLICFAIIQLPPNDIITRRMQELEALGATNVESTIATLKKIYNLDKPLVVQYVIWISGFARGDFGYSLKYEVEVRELIFQRLPPTFLIILPSLFFAYLIAIVVGLYSATHQYSLLDHTFTFLGMIGLGIPTFLLALLFLYIISRFFGLSVGGLFSPSFVEAPWSLAKVYDLLKHVWGPVLILAAYYAAGLIRIVRTRTLDTLREQHVMVARSKGLPEQTIILRHVFRLAVNPLISIMGLQLAEVISGGVMMAIVLNLPTLGPLLLEALQTQDMYLGGAILMLMIIILLAGNFLVDIVLAWIDPRIRYD